MNDRVDPRQAMHHAGLCDTCRYARVITSDRGQRFLRCERSATDPAFPKYPLFPVLVCAGHEPGPQPAG